MDQMTVDGRRDRGRSMRTALAVIIVFLVLLLAVLAYFFFRVLAPAGIAGPSGPGSGDGLIWIRSLYGYGPTQEEQLWRPTSVAIGPNGDIYATDPQRSRIMVFNPSGGFVRLISTPQGQVEHAGFTRPEAIDVADNGEVYVADSWLSAVVVLNDQGRVLRQWYVDGGARGVSVHGDEVFVLGVGRVFVYSTEGEPQGSFGQRGQQPGQIDAYQGIVSDGKYVYVADSLNGRLQAFDHRGEAVWTQPPLRDTAIGSKVTKGSPNTQVRNSTEEGDSPYDLPQDLIFDGNGRLIMIDAFAFKVFVVNPKNGHVVASYGDWGARDGAFLYPTAIDYDPQRDWFAIADTKNNRVQIVSLPGTGGGAMAALRRGLVSPYRYCAIPLGLLFLAVLIAALSSRKRRDEPAVETV